MTSKRLDVVHLATMKDHNNFTSRLKRVSLSLPLSPISLLPSSSGRGRMKGERMVSSIFALAEAEADGWAKVRYIADQKFSYIDTPFPWEKWSMEHLLVLNKGVERGSCILWEDYYDSVIFALNGDIEITLSSLFDRKYLYTDFFSSFF